MRAALLFVIGLACAAGACGGAQRDADNLADSIRTFNDGMRWQRYANAAVYVPAPQRSKFVDEMDERGDDLKVTDYEIVKVDNRGPREARVQVKVSWYKDSEGTLRETHAVQTWELHGKAWLMVDESRLRGAEMPGLQEIMMKDDGPHGP